VRDNSIFKNLSSFLGETLKQSKMRSVVMRYSENRKALNRQLNTVGTANKIEMDFERLQKYLTFSQK